MSYDPDNIIIPPSFPSLSHLSSLSLDQLFNEKDSIEAQLSTLSDILKTNNADMNTHLLTSDGFPRTDIDVAQIRTTRAKIIHLRTDYSRLMDVVEQKMHDRFAEIKKKEREERKARLSTTCATIPITAAAAAAQTKSNQDRKPSSSSSSSSAETDQKPSSTSPQQPQSQSEPPPPPPPFARVNSVAPNSPAATAGLLPNDKIRIFGELTCLNHDNLRALPALVARYRDRPCVVRVQREGELDLRLHLVPREGWGGRGLLGCHIVPL